MTRNKKYNYFYKSTEDGKGKGLFENNFKLPYIEKIGRSSMSEYKWDINNNKNDKNRNENVNNKGLGTGDRTDHSVL